MLILIELLIWGLIIWFVIARWDIVTTFRPKWMGGKYGSLEEWLKERQGTGEIEGGGGGKKTGV